ncbi:MAG: hypothetical protein ABJE95_36755 [Byssovorax sp.]
MTATAPVVNVAEKTVSYIGKSFYMRPLGEDTFTVIVEGVEVGRAIFTFGAGNGVPEKLAEGAISEEDLTTVAEAWFAAIEPA